MKQAPQDVSVELTFSPEVTAFRAIVGSIQNSKFQLSQMYLGQCLTLADASFSDPEQRKAFKDMIRNIFYNTREVHFHGLIWALGAALSSETETNLAESEIGSIQHLLDPSAKILGDIKLIVKQ